MVTQMTGKDDSFWEEIEREFSVLEYEPLSFVLSPKQTRLFHLAQLRVPKYRSLLNKYQSGEYIYCIIGKEAFELNNESLVGAHLVDIENLESKYVDVPHFIDKTKTWPEIIQELQELINNRQLNDRFAKLWGIYLKRIQLENFLAVFDPFYTNTKDAENKESSVVQKYIYAHWMAYHRYSKKHGEKARLHQILIEQKYELCPSDNITPDEPWYYAYLRDMIPHRNSNDKMKLSRTVSDMLYDEIQEYANDGVFSITDFKELFSAR